MPDAPKRIWAEPGEATQGMWWDRDHGTGDIGYVRADIADGWLTVLKAVNHGSIHSENGPYYALPAAVLNQVKAVIVDSVVEETGDAE